MKFLIIILLLIFSASSFANSRFGELTEFYDEKMRGKVNQWIRPHPGPYIWNHIEPEQGKFNWDEADNVKRYSQEHKQEILATIWPYANWDQKSCKRKKSKSPFGKHFSKYLSKPCSMKNYLNFVSHLIDRYDGNGMNDMPGLENPIIHWEIMNEPELKMFFKGSEEEFIEIFKETSKLIRTKQKNSIIVMAGAAGMYPEMKIFWSTVLPEIKDDFDIANIHHITGPNGECNQEMWVKEFASLLKQKNINKPIWLTEAMTGKCKVIKTYVNAFISGAEVIIDVGVNAPGPKISKKNRQLLDEFIKNVDGFKKVKLISKNKAEFTFKDETKKIIDF